MQNGLQLNTDKS